MRARHGAVLVGGATARADDPMLTARLARGPDPLRVVVSARGRLPESSRLARTAREVPVLLAAASGMPRRRRAALEALGVEVAEAGRGRVDPRALLRLLGRRGVRSVMLEGGGATNWGFLRAGLVDEAVVTVAPFLLGGRRAPTLVDGEGFASVASAARLSLARAERRGCEVVLTYRML